MSDKKQKKATYNIDEEVLKDFKINCKSDGIVQAMVIEKAMKTFNKKFKK